MEANDNLVEHSIALWTWDRTPLGTVVAAAVADFFADAVTDAVTNAVTEQVPDVVTNAVTVAVTDADTCKDHWTLGYLACMQFLMFCHNLMICFIQRVIAY